MKVIVKIENCYFVGVVVRDLGDKKVVKLRTGRSITVNEDQIIKTIQAFRDDLIEK